MHATFSISPARTRSFQRLAADFHRVMGDRFTALIAYGEAESLAFVASIHAGDLDALGTLAPAWRHDGLSTPLVLTPDEFRRSLDAFPFEYQSILDSHVVVDGRSPLPGVAVNPEDLRRACEVEAKGHLIHLRQGWLDAGGDADRLARLLARSSRPWRLVATRIAGLDGHALADDAAVARWTTERTGLAEDLAVGLLRLEREPEHAASLVDRLPEYLAAAERLWHASDQWPRR